MYGNKLTSATIIDGDRRHAEGMKLSQLVSVIVYIVNNLAGRYMCVTF